MNALIILMRKKEKLLYVIVIKNIYTYTHKYIIYTYIKKKNNKN